MINAKKAIELLVKRTNETDSGMNRVIKNWVESKLEVLILEEIASYRNYIKIRLDEQSFYLELNRRDRSYFRKYIIKYLSEFGYYCDVSAKDAEFRFEEETELSIVWNEVDNGQPNKNGWPRVMKDAKLDFSFQLKEKSNDENF